MNFINKFKNWGDNWEYKKCEDCNSVYRIYKPKLAQCRYCGSKNICNISEEDWKYYLIYR